MEEQRKEPQSESARLTREAVKGARFMPILMCAFAAAGLALGYFCWSGRYMWGMLIGAALGSLVGTLVDLLLDRIKRSKAQIREAKAMRDGAKKPEEH